MPSQRYHPDVLIFIILIPVIRAINYDLTNAHIRLNLFLAITFLLDTAQGYAAWCVVGKIILYLEPGDATRTESATPSAYSATMASWALLTTRTRF